MKRLHLILSAIWRWYRRRTPFQQALLVVPVLFAIIFSATIGGMGLALMGTAVGIPALVAGWTIGFFGMVLGKAGFIVAKDRRRTK